MNFNPKIVTDGLIFCLDAADKKSYSGSGTTWYDRSSSKDNATLVNDPAFINKGFDLDGVDDRITFDTPFEDEGDITCIVWFKGEEAEASAYAYLLHNNGTDTSTGNSYLTIGVLGGGEYYAALDGQYSNMSTGIESDSSTIYQIALTWDGTTQKVYMNGELKNSRSLSVNSNTLSATTSIGSYRTSTYRIWNGEVYIVHIYNRALSQEELKQNFNAMRGRFGV